MGIAGYASEVILSNDLKVLNYYSMKKILFLALCLIALSPISLMAETVSATDPRVTFVGRAMVENGAVRFDWPST